MRRKIVAGHGKMNHTLVEGGELAKEVAAGKKKVGKGGELIIAPPFTHLP